MLKKLNIKLESLYRQSKYSLENPENSEISEICLSIQKWQQTKWWKIKNELELKTRIKNRINKRIKNDKKESDMVWYGHETALEEKKNFPSFLSFRFFLIGRELFLKILQFVNLSFFFQKYNDTISGFLFCPGTIFKHCLGSRDTPNDITVKKLFFPKILETYRSIERFKKTKHFSKKSNTWKYKQVLSYFKLKFLWIQGVVSIKKVFAYVPQKI